jgi:hypothetical protein
MLRAPAFAVLGLEAAVALVAAEDRVHRARTAVGTAPLEVILLHELGTSTAAMPRRRSSRTMPRRKVGGAPSGCAPAAPPACWVRSQSPTHTSSCSRRNEL